VELQFQRLGDCLDLCSNNSLNFELLFFKIIFILFQVADIKIIIKKYKNYFNIFLNKKYFKNNF
jgi:hypothetical protein